MSQTFEELRRLARDEFLGVEDVVGVGETDDRQGALVFMLGINLRRVNARFKTGHDGTTSGPKSRS